jgi:outer membrane lipoprotein-sorting protein
MRTLVLFSCIIFALASFGAVTPEQKGLSIAKKMQAQNDGFVGEDSEMEMVLIDAYGAKTTRVMEGKVMEVDGDGDKSISIFLNPKDVKGTKMLTHTHKDDDDDQWLYLPTVRRVKRISSSNKSSAFMGSEFSYEDLGSQEIEKYNFKWLKDIKGKGWLVQRVPKTKSGYSKMVMTVSKKYMNPVKIEYFDRKSELLKVGVFSNWKQFKIGKKVVWRANKIHMKNVQTKKESIFEWKNRKLGVKHKTRDFNKTALKR